MASNLASRLLSIYSGLNDANNTTRNALVLGFLVCFVVYWWITRRKYRLPPGPTGLPIVGYLPFLGKEPHKVLKRLSDKYGNVFGLYMGRRYVVILGDYAAVKEAYSQSATLGRLASQFSFFPDGAGLSTANGNEWTEQRRYTIRAMRDIGLVGSKWETLLMEEIKDILEMVESRKGEPMNFQKLLSESISNNITTLVHGKRFPLGDPARQLVDRVIELTADSDVTSYRNFFPFIDQMLSKIGLDQNKDLNRAFERYTNFAKKEVEERKKIRKNEDSDIFIDGYLTEIENNLKNGLNNSFDESNLRGSMATLLIAGSDTTTASLGWLFIAMALHPEVQEKVHRELDAVLGKDGQAKYTERSKLPYTYAVQMEGSRWKTIVPLGVIRMVLEDTKIGGYDVPKDALVMPNLWAIQTSPKYWKEPEKFIPERFMTDEGQIIDSKTEGYAPFSYGKRNCPGESVAKISIFLYFIAMMQRFKVVAPEGRKPTLESKSGLTAAPLDHELRFVKRE